MSKLSVYRNESLIQMETYETDPQRADALVNEIRVKWALLREKGYAGDYPVEILRKGGDTPKVVEIFKWRSRQDQVNAEKDEDIQSVEESIARLVTAPVPKEQYTQAIRGFNQNFPAVGGVELLKGICSCLLTIDGIVEDYPMSVKNGIVLMHRSPRMDIDGDGHNEMYLNILMHGGEIVQTAMGPIRVEQNFSKPNDGLVKSNQTVGSGNDFPATALWRVAWKIQTAMGAVLTDPEQPLIFGPATVTHYPPVGTHFHATTGAVDLIHEETGKKVGTLKPGELTAFDIVTTKDDEIYADFLNTPPDDIFEILEAHRPLLEQRDAATTVYLPPEVAAAQGGGDGANLETASGDGASLETAE